MKKIIIWLVLVFFIAILYSFFYSVKSNEIVKEYEINNSIEKINTNEKEISNVEDIIEKKKEVFHIKTPESVKSLYFSASAINNNQKLENFFKIAKEKEINSITIDIKEVDWYISFDLDDSRFWTIKPVSRNVINNIDELIKKLHDNGIYIIARMAIFKDKRLAEARPDLAIQWAKDRTTWEDYKWYKYTDPYSKEVWDYHVNLATAVYDLWFDEINFDYIRFPTDWEISKTYYPFSNEIYSKDRKWGRVKVIDKFSNYATAEIRKYNPDIVLSADIFGLVTDYTMYQIGQNLESFLLAFDYLGPMVYPSHYWEWYYGLDYPDNNPYEVVATALKNARNKIDALNLEIQDAHTHHRSVKLNDSFVFDERLISDEEIKITKIRPFLQWFSCTRCNNYRLYNREKFRENIRAVNDAWISSWWVWSSWANYRYERYNK